MNRLKYSIYESGIYISWPISLLAKDLLFRTYFWLTITSRRSSVLNLCVFILLVKREKQIDETAEADLNEDNKRQLSVPAVNVRPRQKSTKSLTPKKEHTTSEASDMSDATSQETDFTVAGTDDLDDDFGDGDESGLEEELEMDHTTDTNKIAKKIAKGYSKPRKGKKGQLKVRCCNILRIVPECSHSLLTVCIVNYP